MRPALERSLNPRVQLAYHWARGSASMLTGLVDGGGGEVGVGPGHRAFYAVGMPVFVPLDRSLQSSVLALAVADADGSNALVALIPRLLF
jgi:hypothetical protein